MRLTAKAQKLLMEDLYRIALFKRVNLFNCSHDPPQARRSLQMTIFN